MKQYLTAVNFELTRRCNMNCEFCAKGESQNIDITTDIIDKALDELSKLFQNINLSKVLSELFFK